MKNKSVFSEQIKHIRTSNELTQEELSKKLHVSRQTVSSWENNRNLPDLKMVVDISNLFDISLDQLIKGDDNMTKKLINDGSEQKKVFYNGISTLINGFALIALLICITIYGAGPVSLLLQLVIGANVVVMQKFIGTTISRFNYLYSAIYGCLAVILIIYAILNWRISFDNSLIMLVNALACICFGLSYFFMKKEINKIDTK